MSYHTNRYIYIDKKKKIKFEIFARTVDTADELANKMSIVTNYKLIRAKLFFKTPVLVEIPPYELEQAQMEYVEGLTHD